MTKKIKSGFLWELTATFDEEGEIIGIEMNSLDKDEAP